MELLQLEQQRQALEKSLQTLRSSLKHWQTWEAEYEGLKEEIDSFGADPDEAALNKLGNTYDGELVNEREIRDLTGLTQQTPRSAEQILGMIARRQEYVQRNIDTIQRRFWDNEAKLEELDFAASSAATRNGDSGFPLTEIHEELDEDDNVISSSTSQPESNTVQLVDSLRKAGLSDQDLSGLTDAGSSANETGATISGISDTASPTRSLSPKKRSIQGGSVNSDDTSHDEAGPERPSIRKKSVSFTADTKPAPEPIRTNSDDGRKSVSFADKVSVAPAASSPDMRSVSFSPKIEEIPASSSGDPDPNSDVQKALRTQFRAGDKVLELNDDDEISATHIVLPEDEPHEDAQTRREMLEYNLNEVGHVVAQLDLDEDDDYNDGDNDDTTSASDFAPSEHMDEDTPYTSGGSESEDDEDEDEYGRTTRRVLTDDYHQRMRELETRLTGNLGPAPSDRDISAVDSELDPRDVRRLVVREKRSSISSVGSDSEKRPSSKKRVSFAEALDIADVSSPAVKASQTQGDENVAPMDDAIIERSTTRTPTSAAPDFSEPIDSDNHSGPPGKIIAEQLIERTSATRRNAPPSADGFDPITQRRQLAAEYYRRRNDIIKQQGGFTQDADDDDDEGVEWMEEKDGKVKKVSKFKSARIRS